MPHRWYSTQASIHVLYHTFAHARLSVWNRARQLLVYSSLHPWFCIRCCALRDRVEEELGSIMLSIFRIGAGKSAPPRAEKGKATAAEKTEIPKDAASLCECLGNASKETTKIIYDVLKSLIMLFIYMIIGVFAYHEIEKDQQWTYIDAAYFSMATMSTVGYGDISPTPGASRGFTIFMIFFGIVFVFSSVANAIGSLTGPITYKGRQFMEYLMPQIPVDLDGDGGVDYYKPRPPLIYYSKNLLPSILLNMALQLVSAAIFCSLNTSWSFGDAFYHCLVTATTVGYGDTNNSTQGGRLWACFHIMLSVCLLGELISTFDELATRRKATLERVRCLERVLDDELLDQLMTRAKIMRPLVIRDGKGLTELEFVLAMIVEVQASFHGTRMRHSYLLLP